jgi:hypothetical protein
VPQCRAIEFFEFSQMGKLSTWGGIFWLSPRSTRPLSFNVTLVGLLPSTKDRYEKLGF